MAEKGEELSQPPATWAGRMKEIVINYFPLGFITFGGPTAHVALLQALFVENKKWLDSQTFAELFGICQALPGPGSTQLAFSIALCRAGLAGGFLAFLLWSVPMLIVVIALAYGVSHIGDSPPSVLIQIVNALVATAVGLVALAAYTLGKKVCTDNITTILCLFSASCAIAYQAAWLEPSLIIFGGVVTAISDNVVFPWLERRKNKKKNDPETVKSESERLKPPSQSGRSASDESNESEKAKGEVADNNSNDNNEAGPTATPGADKPANQNLQHALNVQSPATPTKDEPPDPAAHLGYGPILGVFWFLLWVVLLVTFLVVRASLKRPPLALYVLSNLFIAGSLIFGGGPVVVPLLHTYVVDPGWLREREFLLGVAFTNALPGPNFNFAAYCAALALRGQNLVGGGVLGWFAIFAPGLLIKLGLLPFWRHVRKWPFVKTVFRGVNACAVGLVFFAVWVLFQKAASGGSRGSALGAYPLLVILIGVGFVLPGLLKIQPLLVLLAGAITGFFAWLATK